MAGLADVDGFKICMQVCVWLGFPPLKPYEVILFLKTYPELPAKTV